MTAWTIETVADRFHEAAVTAQRLPGVGFAGYVTVWPEIPRKAWEARDARIVRIPASPAAIDRFVETTRWLRWLDEEQRHLVWARAQHRSWKGICVRLGCHRATAWRRWHHALVLVAVRLNDTPPRILEIGDVVDVHGSRETSSARCAEDACAHSAAMPT